MQPRTARGITNLTMHSAENKLRPPTPPRRYRGTGNLHDLQTAGLFSVLRPARIKVSPKFRVSGRWEGSPSPCTDLQRVSSIHACRYGNLDSPRCSHARRIPRESGQRRARSLFQLRSRHLSPATLEESALIAETTNNNVANSAPDDNKDRLLR